eukprot:CAMPEP_0171456502 /NCGR_PEP_ID=MMETSP0945-20130129/2960_1 /TAXON_ID=109269 /ORGANISM="Vaucheria litorea, Strain CCMP2940" /LENGTH=68 /DNA_ID=CAMNT_0011981933 /DNA_START=271 /DNA_END=477 /DNA_ORIENTATION=+
MTTNRAPNTSNLFGTKSLKMKSVTKASGMVRARPTEATVGVVSTTDLAQSMSAITESKTAFNEMMLKV